MHTNIFSLGVTEIQFLQMFGLFINFINGGSHIYQKRIFHDIFGFSYDCKQNFN